MNGLPPPDDDRDPLDAAGRNGHPRAERRAAHRGYLLALLVGLGVIVIGLATGSALHDQQAAAAVEAVPPRFVKVSRDCDFSACLHVWRSTKSDECFAVATNGESAAMVKVDPAVCR